MRLRRLSYVCAGDHGELLWRDARAAAVCCQTVMFSEFRSAALVTRAAVVYAPVILMASSTVVLNVSCDFKISRLFKGFDLTFDLRVELPGTVHRSAWDLQY